MSNQKGAPEPIIDAALDGVVGGGGANVLLGDGSVKFAAERSAVSRSKPGDGSVKSIGNAGTGNGI